jgi:hypothetical protein
MYPCVVRRNSDNLNLKTVTESGNYFTVSVVKRIIELSYIFFFFVSHTPVPKWIIYS